MKYQAAKLAGIARTDFYLNPKGPLVCDEEGHFGSHSRDDACAWIADPGQGRVKLIGSFENFGMSASRSCAGRNRSGPAARSLADPNKSNLGHLCRGGCLAGRGQRSAPVVGECRLRSLEGQREQGVAERSTAR